MTKIRLVEDTKSVNTDKDQALQSAIAQIERSFGKGSIMKLGDRSRHDVPVISTGSVGLDVALGVGGLPKGRIVEIYGPESSGKTTLALHVLAQAQKQGLACAFVDAEHALDPSYAGKLGINVEDLILSQPDSGEQALEITDTLVRSGAVGVVVVDSVAALVPRAELEGEMGDSHMGLHARLMSQALRKLTGSTSKTNCMVIFINQTRLKIGVVFGNPETTTGGLALKFYASVRLEIRRTGAIKEREQTIGNHTRAKVVKNKMAPPFRNAEFDILYGKGISKLGELVDIGSQQGVLEKSGIWISYKGEKLGQGKQNAVSWLRENPKVAKAIEEEIRESLKEPTEKPATSKAAAPVKLRKVETPAQTPAQGKAEAPAEAQNQQANATPEAQTPTGGAEAVEEAGKDAGAKTDASAEAQAPTVANAPAVGAEATKGAEEAKAEASADSQPAMLKEVPQGSK